MDTTVALALMCFAVWSAVCAAVVVAAAIVGKRSDNDKREVDYGGDRGNIRNHRHLQNHHRRIAF